ncbi:MAG: tRNA (adenosine(37)-N6)-dimethylallyltransferase MiaA [Planctomycetaceae bacterium]
MEKPRFVAILGPTATGKSSLALHLAEKFGGEIISADSVQVYRGLDIGSAKPSAEDRRRIAHHLIDILDPDQGYSASAFREQAGEIIRRLWRGNSPVFVAGGTGLYLKVLSRGLFRGPGGDPRVRKALRHKAETEGSASLHKELTQWDPETASRIHPRDTFRLIRALEVYSLSQKPISQFQKEHGFRENPYQILKIGLKCEREELYRRIESRVDEMMKKGWPDEVRSLLEKGYSAGLKSLQSLGYKRLVSHLSGEIDLDRAVQLIKQDTRRFAKRQITWFKADPEIRWFSASRESYGAIEAAVSVFSHQC